MCRSSISSNERNLIEEKCSAQRYHLLGIDLTINLKGTMSNTSGNQHFNVLLKSHLLIIECRIQWIVEHHKTSLLTLHETDTHHEM